MTANGRITSADTFQGQLADDSSATFVLIDTGVLQTGWAVLEYDGESRISGMLTFRQRVSGRPDFESSVSLTRDDESRVYMPFDNTLGYATTLAITNPSASDNTNLQLRFWDASGGEILTSEIQLSARLYRPPFHFRRVIRSYRTLRPIADSGFREQSAMIALRFNPSGAFSTVPVVSR